VGGHGGVPDTPDHPKKQYLQADQIGTYRLFPRNPRIGCQIHPCDSILSATSCPTLSLPTSSFRCLSDEALVFFF
jgi:hypothetical protein